MFLALAMSPSSALSTFVRRAPRPSGSTFCYDQDGRRITCPLIKTKIIVVCSIIGSLILGLILYYVFKRWRKNRPAARDSESEDDEAWHILQPKVVPPTDSVPHSHPGSAISSPYSPNQPLPLPHWKSTTTLTSSRPPSPAPPYCPSPIASPRPSAELIPIPVNVHSSPRPSSPITPLFR